MLPIASKYRKIIVHILNTDDKPGRSEYSATCQRAAHAGIQGTPKLMYLDPDHQWIRTDKMAPGGKWEDIGVDGDPRAWNF